MVTFSGCEQEARDIFAARQIDADFHAQLEHSSTSWKMEFPVFTRRVEGIITIALFSDSRHGLQ
ncbi:hypothetical protein ABTY96_43910 [Streptomyces sp. NPDC096057]|uniref:hypothetical protein n=1 Tax=Streptomyces sp. NPDC096057 TaxID=3155543 RepID=UPI00332D2790